MASAAFAHPALAAHAVPATSPVAALLLRAGLALVMWETRAKTRRTLRSLDPQQLFDIGLTRAEALHEADKPFWQA